MNNYPNNDKRNRPAPGNGARPSVNRPPMPNQGTPRRQANGATPGSVPPRMGQPPRPVPPNRRPPQKKSGLAKLAVIWISVLAILLIIIFVIAFAREKGRSEGLPASGTTESVSRTALDTETEDSLAVDYADPTDGTVGFAASHDFTNGILIDLETNSVLASRNGDARIYPASMTKIMTMIVAVEETEDLDETFTMTAEITDPLYLANASVAGFLVGEEVTVRDLIYGLILPSGGDGALGLAYHIAGSEEAFAELMNEKAKELGLKDTHFTNCTGLHGEDHYSTCHEIALILEYAIKDEFMREVLTTYKYVTEKTPEHPEGIEIYSTLLSRMNGDESGTMFVQGGKTGFTTEAKNCLASFATELIPGMSEDDLKDRPTKYILVTAGSGEKFGPVFSAIDIYKGLGDEDTDVSETVSGSTSETFNDGKTAETKKESIKIYTAAEPS